MKVLIKSISNQNIAVSVCILCGGYKPANEGKVCGK